MLKRKHKKIPASIKVIVSFLGVILIGTLILMLPITAKYPETGKSLRFIDALFMTTSAVCVTGLSVVSDVGPTFTLFGKIVMAILIEIGGLSFLTISIFIFIIFKRKIGLSERFLMKEALNQDSAGGVIKLIKMIVPISLSIQLFGAIMNMIALHSYYPNFFTLLGVSVFHSVSSFNNAGFDIFGNADSMIHYSTDVFLNINTMFLILSGGLGFGVIREILNDISWKNNAYHLDYKNKYALKTQEKHEKKQKGSFKTYFSKKRRLSMQSRIILGMTLGLFMFGFIIFYFAGHMTVLEAFFQSVTARTAGFATIDMSDPEKFNNASYITMIFLMFVGASPCSTGGGVKTTTLFAILISLFAYARGRKLRVHGRNISDSSTRRAYTLVVAAILHIAIATLIISAIESNLPINKIVFEVVSAFGTVGLSMGITGSLHAFSKFVLVITMFIGRLGPLTLLGFLAKSSYTKEEEVRYVEENIMIG